MSALQASVSAFLHKALADLEDRRENRSSLLPLLVESASEVEDVNDDSRMAYLWALWDAWYTIQACPSPENIEALKWAYCEFVHSTDIDTFLSIRWGEYETTINLRLYNSVYQKSFPTFKTMRVNYAG
jgi:hypothetical protein